MRQLKHQVALPGYLGRPPKIPPTRLTRISATVMFTDVEDSTGLARALGITGIALFLKQNMKLIRGVIEDNQGRVLSSTGDGVFAFWDKGEPHHAASARLALLAAAELSGQIAEENARRHSAGLPTRRVRIGLNSGEVALEQPTDDRDAPHLYGATIHEARRIEQAGKRFREFGEGAIIMAAPATLELAGFGIDCISNGGEPASPLDVPRPGSIVASQDLIVPQACAAVPLHPRAILATLLGCPV